VMRLMYILALSAFHADSEVLALICLRMVQTSLNHGICDETAYGLSVLCILCYNFGQIDDALGFYPYVFRIKQSRTNACLEFIASSIRLFIHIFITIAQV